MPALWLHFHKTLSIVSMGTDVECLKLFCEIKSTALSSFY